MLSVDDSAIHQKAITLMLKPSGHHVVTVRSAVDALRYICLEPLLPDVILLDLVRGARHSLHRAASQQLRDHLRAGGRSPDSTPDIIARRAEP